MEKITHEVIDGGSTTRITTEAWEDGGWTAYRIAQNPCTNETISKPTEELFAKRREFFQKLIDEV